MLYKSWFIICFQLFAFFLNNILSSPYFAKGLLDEEKKSWAPSGFFFFKIKPLHCLYLQWTCSMYIEFNMKMKLANYLSILDHIPFFLCSSHSVLHVKHFFCLMYKHFADASVMLKQCYKQHYRNASKSIIALLRLLQIQPTDFQAQYFSLNSIFCTLDCCTLGCNKVYNSCM